MTTTNLFHGNQEYLLQLKKIALAKKRREDRLVWASVSVAGLLLAAWFVSGMQPTIKLDHNNCRNQSHTHVIQTNGLFSHCLCVLLPSFLERTSHTHQQQGNVPSTFVALSMKQTNIISILCCYCMCA